MSKNSGEPDGFPFFLHGARCRSQFGEELSVEKLKKAVWLRPEAVAQIEFLEWTDADRLPHSNFVGLREDTEARNVTKEHSGES
jgi:ATP-dependent DNA ligase